MRTVHRITPLVLLSGLLFVRCDCGTDPIPMPDPSVYHGVYVFKTGEDPGADSLVQAITWIFTETNYLMDTDTTSDMYDPSVCFCKGRGTYIITDRIQLAPVSPDTPLPDNCDTCDPAQSPQGSYMLERPNGGLRIVRIEVIDGIQVTSRIELEPTDAE